MKPSEREPQIIWLQAAESTNSELKRHIGTLDNLSIIAVREQTAGRGQGDHTWHSAPGENLTFSVLLRFGKDCPLAASEVLLITQMTTLAIRSYLLRRGVAARIKWPNDIWVGGKKICGILIENGLQDGWVRESIVGIGLNLNQRNWPPELPNPVSLSELTGRRYVPHRELAALHKEICRHFGLLGTGDGRVFLQEEFGKYLFRLPEGPR